MNIRPVNSEQAYDEAIERIETLWGAESGTPEGDELDVLLTLVRQLSIQFCAKSAKYFSVSL